MAEQVIAIGLSEGALARWKNLADAARAVSQICSVSVAGGWKSALVGRGGDVIALGMVFDDARFHAEAKVAVATMAAEIESLQAYARYVADIVQQANRIGILVELPLSYEEWWVRQEETEY